MRWAALIVALLVGFVASCGPRPTPPFIGHLPVPEFVVPAGIPGWWAFCVENPAMNWERPGEPKLPGWTACSGTVDELRDRMNQLRLAQ